MKAFVVNVPRVRVGLVFPLLAFLAPIALGDAGPIDEIVVTATREPATALELPFSVHVIGREQIVERQYRTLPQALREVPGLMVQETAFGQGSPYLRGFTGFRTLFLQDGVRLNNSVFRDGPNQYWATVDLFGVDRLEVVQGPASTLYGSDAIGGTVNALGTDPLRASSRALLRMASAEESLLGRVEFVARPGTRTALAGGVTGRTSDELHGGSKVGSQEGVGYDEAGADLRVKHDLGGDWTLEAALQSIDQNNVPRTHTTRDAVSWHGTTVGGDIQRELDQERLFSYVRIANAELDGVVDGVSLTAAYTGVEEVQDRIRASGAREKQGFDVDTVGLLAGFRSDSAFGTFTYGVDYYRDSVDSFSTSNPVQGPVADDARYESLDFYLQDRISWWDRGELVLGMRHTRIDLLAQSVNDPVTGAAFQIEADWSATVGSAGVSWAFLPDRLVAFANASQGFRAPNLSDLSRFDSARTNEIEVPVAGLDEERFLSLETGIKFRSDRLDADLAYFHTGIDDLIQRVPTGRIVDGEYEVTKANVGDGEVEGIELSWRATLGARIDLFGHATWMDGEAETYPTSEPVLVAEPLDKLMPLSGAVGLRYRPGERFWLESELVVAAGQDDLSTRDAADTSRIPPGGTPGYAVVHLRGGLRLAGGVDLVLGIDNVTDVDYRIHGSGTNMPGRNVILTVGLGL